MVGLITRTSPTRLPRDDDRRVDDDRAGLAARGSGLRGKDAAPAASSSSSRRSAPRCARARARSATSSSVRAGAIELARHDAGDGGGLVARRPAWRGARRAPRCDRSPSGRGRRRRRRRSARQRQEHLHADATCRACACAAGATRRTRRTGSGRSPPAATTTRRITARPRSSAPVDAVADAAHRLDQRRIARPLRRPSAQRLHVRVDRCDR